MINTLVLLLLYYITLSRTGVFTDSQKDPVNVSFNAIKNVHALLDDDNDGQIDKKESADYMQFELKAPDTNRQLTFHNNDAHISVDELWKRWVESPVYSWTVDQVISWLIMSVKLPKYEEIFRWKKVMGKNMPRLATSKGQYVQHELKITNAIDRKKIYLRAADLILFGDTDRQEEKQPEKPVDKNFLAIKAIHSHLDDDRDGDIDVEESDEFVRDELEGSNNKRHERFHSSDDKISVDDLWKHWKYSIVYNWTNAEVITWLKDVVGLPQYETVFREKNVTGKDIPKLATEKSSFLQKELGILNATHRKKIYLRACDIILFGAPEVRRNYFSDTIVLVIMLLATLVVCYARHKQNVSKKEIEQLTSNMEHLQQAEQMLKELQQNEHGKKSGSNYDTREIQLRVEIDEAKKEAERLHLECSKFEEEKTKIQFLEQELHELRSALAKAESELRYNEFRSPDALQSCLQVTYRKEIQHFHTKKQLALSQMQEAKEACEKVSKTRRTVLGSLRLAHGQSIDVVDQKILNAKSALAEVTKDLQERQNRWQKIEHICSFNIMNDDVNVNAASGHIISKGLADNLVFGSKGMEVAAGFHCQIAGITENEKLDYEVETITQKGTLERTSTESSCSQESIHMKGSSSDQQQKHSPHCFAENTSANFTQQSKDLSDLQNHVSSRFFEKTGIINNSGYEETSGSVLLRNRDSITSFNTENSRISPSPHSEQSSRADSPKIKRSTLEKEKVYTRANTEPNNLNRIALENRTNEKLKHGSQKIKSYTRPLSECDIGLLQKTNVAGQQLLLKEGSSERDSRLRSNTRPKSEFVDAQKLNIEIQKSLRKSDESLEREPSRRNENDQETSSNKVEFDSGIQFSGRADSDHGSSEKMDGCDRESLHTHSDDDYKSDEPSIHTSNSNNSISTETRETKKQPKGLRKLFQRKGKTSPP